MRLRHYSRRTEKAYIGWIRRYILFHDKRHPAEMSAPELTRFLSSLAVDGHVAASTQHQAPGGVFMGILITIVSVVVVTAAAILERILKHAVDIQSENNLTV